MTSLTREQIAELRELYKAATEGPWYLDGTKTLGASFIWQKAGLGTRDAKLVCRLGSNAQDEWLRTIEQRTADGRYLVAVHDLMPALLDMAEKLLEQGG